MLFFQALQSSVKYVPVLPAWKTVKRMKKNMIVDGALTVVLKCLSTIKEAKVLQKAVSLKICVILVNNSTTAKKSKGQHANLIAAIQMAAIAVQCL